MAPFLSSETVSDRRQTLAVAILDDGIQALVKQVRRERSSRLAVDPCLSRVVRVVDTQFDRYARIAKLRREVGSEGVT